MLFYYLRYCCPSYILLSLIFWAFAGYAYRVNKRRLADDPEKKDFHPTSVYLAPITWFPLIIAYIFMLVIKAVLYGIFLVLFTIAIVVIRKSFLLIWLDKVATKIGNMLLKANTRLINFAFGKDTGNLQPI